MLDMAARQDRGADALRVAASARIAVALTSNRAVLAEFGDSPRPGFKLVD